MNKIFKNPLLAFSLGVVFSGTIVYAANLAANDIEFDNTNSSINANNVQDAIDELYGKASSGGGSSKKICTYVDSEYGDSNNHYSIGTKYSCEVKDNTSYNFYVLKTSGVKIDLIMERNITELVGSTKTMDWQSAMNYFVDGEGSSLGWKVIVDLPSAKSIADAVGNNSWQTSSNNWFCLGLHDYNSCTNNNQYNKATDAGIAALAPYKWLVNYTRNCSVFGCDTETSLGDGQASGYWTQNTLSNNNAYNIANFAAMDFNSITTSNKYGVRPVISVSKNQIG